MGENKKRTSKKVASTAGQVLQNENASAIQKRLAASALSQAIPGRQTGADLEAEASAALKSPKYNATTKELAGTVVAQANKERKGSA